MVIYWDVLIIENFCINYFLLYVTFKTIKKRISILKTCMSALLGSLYVLTIFSPYYYIFENIIFKIVVSILMIIIVSRVKGVLELIKIELIFISYSMLIAGMFLFLEMDAKNIIGLNIQNFQIKYLIITILILYTFFDRIVFYIKHRKLLNNYIYDVDITYNNSTVSISAFFDTGNDLRELVTNLPIIIVEKNKLSNIHVDEEKLYTIPYKLVNGSIGYFKGFKPDRVQININKQFQVREALIAYCDRELSTTKDFTGLLSRDILL